MKSFLIGASLTLMASAGAFGQAVLEDFSSIRFPDGTSTLSCPTPRWMGTYSSGTTYSQCDFVTGPGGPPALFVSRTNGNTGNALPYSNPQGLSASWGTPIWSIYIGENGSQQATITTGSPGKITDTATATGASGLYMQFLPSVAGNWSFPGAYAQTFIRSGSWDADYNRLTFQLTCNQNINDGGQAHNLEVGTYTRPHDFSDSAQAGAHYYHFLSPNVYANQPIYVTLNRRPEHEVGGGTSENLFDDPEFGVNARYGSSVHYFDGFTRFYFDWVYNQAVGLSCQMTNVAFSKVAGETDGITITNTQGAVNGILGSLTSTYSGPITGFPHGRYELVFQGPAWITGGQKYNIRYSTSDMHVNGFTSGTSGGQVSGPDAVSYLAGHWYSPDMAQTGTMYIAIQPVGFSQFMQVAVTSGSAASGLTLSPSSVNFSNQNINTTSSAQAFTLTNAGSSAATVSSIAISGANASDFSPSDNCSRSAGGLAASASCTINVTFRPPTTGVRNATITVTDTPDSLTAFSSLTGTGVDPTAIQIVQLVNCGPQSWPGTCSIAATTAGNLIAVSFSAYNGSTSPVLNSITDNATGGSNAYNGIATARSINTAGGQASWNEIWYATNIRAGATALTITPSVTQTGDIQVWEIANVATVNAAGALNSQAATTTPLSPALTTTAAKTAIVAIMHPAATSGGSTGVASPWTSDSLNDNMAWAHYLPTVTGSYTAQWATASTVYASSAVAFAPIAASVPTASAQGVRLSNATLR